jgi:predicted CxxxxCH...CXXCH cytochrome family protein
MKIFKCSSAQVLKWSIGLFIIISMSGCAEKASEPERKTHPTGWADASSANFHAKFLQERGTTEGLQACLECHDGFASTAVTGVSCFGCHAQFPHPAGWADTSSANLHQTYIQMNGWRLDECKACHGADFRTVKTLNDTTTISCFTCHTGNSGPLGCRTCHGGANSSAPPPDLLGGTSTDLITVGTHQVHLNGRNKSDGILCSDCHHRPNGFDDPLHIDTTTAGMAELTFSALATDSGRLTPIWNRTAGTCSSVYCHGAFEGGNDTLVVRWTGGSQEAKCGTCHSLPPSNHTPEQDDCSGCHVYTAASHVDGVVNFR